MKKYFIVIFILFFILIILTFLTPKRNNEKYIIKFSKKYAVDELNKINMDYAEFFYIDDDCIDDDELKITYLIRLLNINFVKVIYYIPSQGDRLRLFLLSAGKHIYLINKKIIYSDYIDNSPPDEEYEKFKKELEPFLEEEMKNLDPNIVPPGYENAPKNNK